MKRILTAWLCLSLLCTLSACRPKQPAAQGSATSSVTDASGAGEATLSGSDVSNLVSSAPHGSTGGAEDQVVVIEDSDIGTITMDFGDTGSSSGTTSPAGGATTTTKDPYIEKYY